MVNQNIILEDKFVSQQKGQRRQSIPVPLMSNYYSNIILIK